MNLMIDVSPSARYAMDGETPVRHVVTVLGGASRPLSLPEIAETYDHPVPSDYTRIKLNERCRDDNEARVWLIKYAITRLGPEQVEWVTADQFRLRLPPDEIRFEDKPVARYAKEKPHFAGGSRLFDPMSGPFSENIRKSHAGDDLSELRESMRELGWVEAFPALVDERGVVLVGHRRLKVAQELGIDPEPHKVTVKLGTGKEADVQRLRLALASNIGSRPMTPADRKHIAAILCGDGWSMQKIGEALGVSQKTISLDLRFLHYTSGIISEPSDRPVRRDTLGRVASPGRGRGGRGRVLSIFAEHPEGLTDHDLSKLTERSYQTASSQRLKLRVLGLIEEVGKREHISNKNRTSVTVSRITEAGKEALENLAAEPLVPPRPKKPKPPTVEHVHKCPHCGLDIGGGET